MMRMRLFIYVNEGNVKATIAARSNEILGWAGVGKIKPPRTV
jgi:hypothetical protein